MKRIGAAAAALFALTFEMAIPTLAGPRDDSVSGISRCSIVTDDRAWLDCVYGAVQPMRAKLGLPPAPASQVSLVPLPAPGAPSQTTIQAGTSGTKTGFWSKIFAAHAEPVASDIIMSSYRFNQQGAFVVSLANGQVWAEDPAEKHFPHWTGAASQYVVSVTPDTGNVLWLRVEGDDNSYRVRRIQ